jgi:hypothetical protein
MSSARILSFTPAPTMPDGSPAFRLAHRCGVDLVIAPIVAFALVQYPDKFELGDGSGDETDTGVEPITISDNLPRLGSTDWGPSIELILSQGQTAHVRQDERGFDEIVVEGPPKRGPWSAVTTSNAFRTTPDLAKAKKAFDAANPKATPSTEKRLSIDPSTGFVPGVFDEGRGYGR